MRETITLTIDPEYAGDLKKGYPLVLRKAVTDADMARLEEGDIIEVVDHHKRFIGKGYHGNQNKGIGWVLSTREDQELDQAFFTKKINKALALRKDFFNDDDTNAFRVFNGEGDGIGGLTIDYFDGYYMMSWYSAGIYSFREFVIEALTELTQFHA